MSAKARKTLSAIAAALFFATLFGLTPVGAVQDEPEVQPLLQVQLECPAGETMPCNVDFAEQPIRVGYSHTCNAPGEDSFRELTLNQGFAHIEASSTDGSVPLGNSVTFYNVIGQDDEGNKYAVQLWTVSQVLDSSIVDTTFIVVSDSMLYFTDMSYGTQVSGGSAYFYGQSPYCRSNIG